MKHSAATTQQTPLAYSRGDKITTSALKKHYEPPHYNIPLLTPLVKRHSRNLHKSREHIGADNLHCTDIPKGSAPGIPLTTTQNAASAVTITLEIRNVDDNITPYTRADKRDARKRYTKETRKMHISMHNRTNAEEQRQRVTERLLAWNKMRFHEEEGNAMTPIRTLRSGQAQLSHEEENELLDVATWWITDDVYRYFRECSNDMCVGAYVTFVPSMRESKTTRENNSLNILLANRIEILAHTPVLYDISSPARATRWHIDLACSILDSLLDDGYDIKFGHMYVTRSEHDNAPHPKTREEAKKMLAAAMREKRKITMQIRWLTDAEATMMEKLHDESQLESLHQGVPIEDVVA